MYINNNNILQLSEFYSTSQMYVYSHLKLEMTWIWYIVYVANGTVNIYIVSIYFSAVLEGKYDPENEISPLFLQRWKCFQGVNAKKLEILKGKGVYFDEANFEKFRGEGET